MTEMPLQMTADDSALYFATGKNVIYEVDASTLTMK